MRWGEEINTSIKQAHNMRLGITIYSCYYQRTCMNAHNGTINDSIVCSLKNNGALTYPTHSLEQTISTGHHSLSIISVSKFVNMEPNRGRLSAAVARVPRVVPCSILRGPINFISPVFRYFNTSLPRALVIPRMY